MARVLQKSNGLPIDHFALGVPDTEKGAADLERLTGAKVYLLPPEPGQWYRSAGLRLGEDCALEILGPNPAWTKFHPLHRLVSRLEQPEILFWYVSTDDFDGMIKTAKAAGAPMERIERINQEDNPALSRYDRGVLGPGFVSQRPCVIEWKRRNLSNTDEPVCSLKAFELSHPKPEPFNALFQALGISISVASGRSQLTAKLATPNGEVLLKGNGLSFRGLSGLVKILGLWLGR
ncbi:MAG: VOC family protein [Pseudomonadota bacterium]